MKRVVYISTVLAACLGMVVFVSGGNLSPPTGPIQGTICATIRDLGTTVGPGRHCLTDDLCALPGYEGDGIKIGGSNVTIDLGGHTLKGVPGSRYGITLAEGVSSASNIVIKNGTICLWGGKNIDLKDAELVSVDGCKGCGGGEGFVIGSYGMMSNSSASGASGKAIEVGASSLVINSQAFSSGGIGFDLGPNTIIKNSISSGNGGFGLMLGDGGTATSCASSNNGDDGIRAGSTCLITGNLCSNNVGIGVNVTGNETRVEFNHLTENGIGVQTLNVAAGNFVANNTLKGNGIESMLLGEVTTEDEAAAQARLAKEQATTAATNALNAKTSADAANANAILAKDNAAQAVTEAQAAQDTRIDVATLSGDADSLHVISQPGSYYLTGNIAGAIGKHGIQITTGNVALDLNGFAMMGNSTGLAGIILDVENVTIRNGSISGWPGGGIDGGAAQNCLFQGLTIFGNGVVGLAAGLGSVVQGCVVTGSGTGISAVGTTVADCTTTGNVTGISADTSTISHCTSYLNGTGIQAFEAATITGCTIRGNYENGIMVGLNCHVTNNTCDDNGVVGIIATAPGAQNRIDGNHVTNNLIGIQLDSSKNVTVRNSVVLNGSNFGSIATGNFTGTRADTDQKMNTSTNSLINIDIF